MKIAPVPTAVEFSHPLPRLRWLAPLWLAVYLPLYTQAYGVANFLFLCNLGVILTAIGLWRGSRLLLSAQAVAAFFIGAVWTLDFGSRLVTGEHLLGVTNYMFDPQYPLPTRLLSLYHVGWPILLLYCMSRLGYDRRAWALQSGIGAAVVVLCRVATPAAENINYAFIDPIFGLQLGPAPVHVAIVIAALTLVLYGPTHLALARAYGAAGRRRASRPDAVAASIRA